MNIIAIFSGRFHPFHIGHKATYDHLARRYGAGNVFVASTNTTAPLTSPFPFEEKRQMMIALGVPKNRIVQVKSPYKADEITSHLDSSKTALVFAVSEKDATRFSFHKKDGSPAYMQPMSDKIELQPLANHAYVEIAPTVPFKVQGQEVISASAIRQLYISSDQVGREQIITDLYGSYLPKIKQIFDRRLALTEAAHVIMDAHRYSLSESARPKVGKWAKIILESEKAIEAEYRI